MHAGQPRAALRATVWEAIDIGEPTGKYLTNFEAHKLASAGAAPWLLPAISELYRRCFGLLSNLSCPRIVGDRQMVGKLIRRLTNPADCEPSFDNRSRTLIMSGCAGGGLPGGRFTCMDEGLAALLARSRAAPLLNGSSWRAASMRHRSAEALSN